MSAGGLGCERRVLDWACGSRVEARVVGSWLMGYAVIGLRRLGRRSVVGRGLDWSGLDSVRVAGVQPSGRTSSSSPGYTKFSGDLSLTSVTSFRRPFFLLFFSVSKSPSPPNSVFGICLVRKGLTLPDLRGFGNPTFCLPSPTVYNM